MDDLLNYFLAGPFFDIGNILWKNLLAMSFALTGITPESFSPGAWSVVSNTLYPFFVAIAATMLNLFFYVGFIRQAGNFRQTMTLENTLDIMFKVVLGNIMLNVCLEFTGWVFSIATAGSKEIASIGADMSGLVGAPGDVGQSLFYNIFGIIYFVIAIVSGSTIFLTVYMRYLNLYMIAATGPCAISCLPGGNGVSNVTGAWVKTLISKSCAGIVFAMIFVLADKIMQGITLTGMFDALGSIAVCVQSMLWMVLLAASIKGADIFMKQTFGI